jgi:purine-nucleoside phosphorylase
MLYDQIENAVNYIRKQTDFEPQYGIILGTGLSDLTTEIDVKAVIDYKNIPHFPVSTVQSHSGKLVLGLLAGKRVIAMAGRFHYYEGYDMKQVTFPVRVMKSLGISHLFMSNAAGGTNENFKPGDIVFVRDHINLLPDNPLRGENDERLGVRFPDLLYAYDRELLHKAITLAKREGIRAHTGVYVCLQGPSLETPAEYNFIYRIGGDLVGMSTVPEVLVAVHSGLKVFVASVVTNKCIPIEELEPTTVEEVIEVAQQATPRLQAVLKGLLEGLE